MTIAITSPEKYEFQDLVCIEQMLRFSGKDEAAMILEPAGGEDGELRFKTADGSAMVIEVQVKGAAEGVGLERICQVLCHFPAYRCENFLLERLYNDPNRMALLIYSGRCEDSASNFVVPPEWMGESLEDDRVSGKLRDDVRRVCLATKPAGNEDGALIDARKKTIARFFKSANAAALRQTLRRVLVMEWRRRADVLQSCQRALAGVPDDRMVDVINRLLDHTTASKRTQSDGLPGGRKPRPPAGPSQRGELSTARQRRRSGTRSHLARGARRRGAASVGDRVNPVGAHEFRSDGVCPR